MFDHSRELCRCLAGVLDWKSHPSCPVHGAQECEGGEGMMGGTPQHPAQHQSRHLASQGTEEKWEREGREVLPSHRVTELLVNVDDEGTFRSPSVHASAPSRDCTLDPTHQVQSSLLTWSNCIKPYLIICGPPYHPPNILKL